MVDDSWAAQAVVEILGLEGPNWEDRVRWIMSLAGTRCHEGLISDDAYARVYETGDGRIRRMGAARDRHQHAKRKSDTLVSFVEDSTAHLVEPEPESKTGHTGPVRGPSKYTLEERRERMRLRRRFADICKLPADCSEEYTRGELAVMSQVIFAIYNDPKGVCTLAVGTILARALVSESLVHDTLCKAKRLGHLLVEQKGRAFNRISIASQRIQKWLLGPDTKLLMEKLKDLLESIKSPDMGTFFTTSTDSEEGDGASKPARKLPNPHAQAPRAVNHGSIALDRVANWFRLAGLPPREVPS